jgi:hypothetical protein
MKGSYTKVRFTKWDVEFVVQSCWMQSSTFSMVVMFHAQNRSTTVLVQGLRGDEISLLSSGLESSSEGSRQGFWFPLLLPAILFEIKSYSTIEYVNTCYREIWDIECATKIRAQSIHTEGRSYNEMQRNGGERLSDGIVYIDFEDITRGITSVSSELARYEYACQSSLPLLDFRDEMRNQHIIAAQVDEHTKQLFHAKNARLRSFFNGLSARVKYLLQRADAQRQTVRNYLTPT